MKNDNMKKNGQFPNVRVEYGFGAVCYRPNVYQQIRHVKEISTRWILWQTFSFQVHHLLMHMNFKVSWPVSWFPPDTGCYREEKAGVQSFNDCFYFSGWSACSEEHHPRSFATRCLPWTMHVSGMLQKKGEGGVERGSKEQKVLRRPCTVAKDSIRLKIL